MTLVATQVKRRRGTTAENDAFTGAEGEITVDLTTHELRVHDGSTVGGHTIPTKKYSYSKTESDNLLSNKANTDLSNLTATGKSKLGVVVYHITGQVLNSANTTVTGIGDLYVSLYPNGIAVIEYTIHGTNGGGTDTDFSWGINRDLISNLNNNIPSITPLYGSCHFYAISSGTFTDEKNGYGGVLVPVGQFWQPGRVYTTSGDIGNWSSSKMGPGTMIFGTAYGTYTV